MYSIMVPRSIVFGLLLAFLLMVFSASSCAQTGADSYLNNSTSTDYRTLASNEAVNAGIPSQLFVRQIQVESGFRSEEHTSELQSQSNLVCRLLLEKKKQQI